MKYLGSTCDGCMHGICKVWDSLRAEPSHADPPAESKNELACCRDYPKWHFDTRLHSDVKQLLKHEMKQIYYMLGTSTKDEV